ncbi:MAG: AEC family transporter [Candidatus Uhrbacteria bacterium]|nr:AEC family transporter [Candidatus Uhrbacteria bacterium]
MTQVLIVIAPLFLIIFTSALLQRFKNIGENWSQVLNEFALKIGLPVLIFSALSKAHFSFLEAWPLILVNSIFIVGFFLFALLLGTGARFSKKTVRTLILCLMFGNIAYLGIPILSQVYGATVLPTVSIIVAIYFIWIFTLGTGYLEATHLDGQKQVVRRTAATLVKNPLLIAVVLGVFVASFAIPIPSVIAQALDMVSSSVTPTVLIVIGLFIGKSTVGKVQEWIPVALFSLATLMIAPAAFYFGTMFFGLSPHKFSTSIIEAAMPLAITPFALADTFDLDKEFISRSIVLSTVLSVFSLPFWISIL